MKFVKMHGLGNDYIYIDDRKNEINEYAKLVPMLSNRHFGIGGDGVILIRESKLADFKMDMYNADGTQSEMCGNGIRCVGKYVYDYGLKKSKRLLIETLAGIKSLELIIENDRVLEVCVDMGKPILEPELIPVKLDGEKIVRRKVEIQNNVFEITCVSMGNPHVVIVVDNLDEYDVAKYGAMIEKDELFPRRTNVEFVEIIGEDEIKMRVWERGTGETLACGTGACAAVVAMKLGGYINKKDVLVRLPGGRLDICWEEGKSVMMQGAATKVFEGMWEK
ncbi:MAG: diaminopimelate epimerase [Lachnospiraceae bacterium]|nr:diaminopimelate epimerase [Lachnospiraceae bacterium]